ncbi:MAG: T9SS type A sorting domain-containing protein [Candidatus Latescibacterota bacterium]|nr:MAG: T9SS type A sorting domain-containing protein [Candidatus Latescibacterota bacterium]
MSKVFTVTGCAFLVLTLFAGAGSMGKSPKNQLPKPRLDGVIQPHANPPDIQRAAQSMYPMAVADTIVLAWWQFEDVNGGPDPQGWIAKDRTEQTDQYFHVDGDGANSNCCPISPINGSQSMWCGQCPSDDHTYCGWGSLPGYGNSWEQFLESTTFACTTLAFAYVAEWDSEPGYDQTFAEYWDDSLQLWVELPVNNGAGHYDDSGGPLAESFDIRPTNGQTKLRFRFESDGAWDDQDGLFDTLEGAFKVDDISVVCQGGGGPTIYFEDFEDEECGTKQTNDAVWMAATTPGYGSYASLHSGVTVVQEDPCKSVTSWLWGFFDDPAVTNYACGGWPLQGAVPYGPDENGRYMNNEIWSPWVPLTGTGTKVIFSHWIYPDMKYDALVSYIWAIRGLVNDCPTGWGNFASVDMFKHEYWFERIMNVSSLIPFSASHLQVLLGVVDACEFWCGVYGTGECHSHGPLFDQVKLVRVDDHGPVWYLPQVYHHTLFQDNFAADGSMNGFARADMAADILSSRNGGILPGDSIAVTIYNADELGEDPVYGGPSVYCFVRVGTNGPPPNPPKRGSVIQSPDVRPANCPNPGSIRYPWVGDISCAGQTWSQYRMDRVCSVSGHEMSDRFCFDLMDIADPRHVNEDQVANVGVFTSGDTIRYFFGGRDSLNEWSYWHRTMDGQGESRSTDRIEEACASPCEFSILPDAGRFAEGDILYVDDADDRGGPAQLYFDTAFDQLQIRHLVDRFDVLDPYSAVGNSLASRVANVTAQIIVPYQKILWNTSDLDRALIGDGGEENLGSGEEKSDDFALIKEFLDNDPENPGVYVNGDDLAEVWVTLTGASAVAVKTAYMNFSLLNGDHTAAGEPVSPTVWSGDPASYPVFDPPQSPYGPDALIAYGGCPSINDFDVLAPAGLSKTEMTYPATGSAAVVAQATPTTQTIARFVLSGLAYNYIHESMIAGQPVPARVEHLKDILEWFENEIPDPVGVDPIAFANRLDNAYPNPFNPTTTIKYSIKEPGHVSLKIYNVAGQLVRTLVDVKQTPRERGFEAKWDGINDAGGSVSSGVYFYKLTTGGFAQTKKMVLLK